jgi:ABC-type multidrug transport system ATPase subunit
VIRFRGVSFAYRPRQPVLAAVDLDLPTGLTLLAGPNGCGKSTLLRLAAGIDPPDAGRIEIDGHDLWTEEVAARAGLAFVPEQPDLTPYASVGEILVLVCRLRGEPPELAAAALAAVGLAGGGAAGNDLARRSVRELSLGQRRRAVLAAALIGTPGHLLLDEPLEAMDRGARDSILAWIAARRAAGSTLLISSHDLEPLLPLADRALTLRHGRCQMIDPLPADGAARHGLLERLARGEPAA